MKPGSFLIVDDNERCVEILELAFAELGALRVTSETNPRVARERIRAERPDLVLLDIKMPELDGFSLLSDVRGEGDATPVIMCSGSSLQSDIDRAYTLGCNGYFMKPAGLDEYRQLASAIVGYWLRGEIPAH